jgi:hypothetical protein
VSEASGGKYGAMPFTLHQRGYDAARIEYTSGVNSNASQSFSEAQKVERETGDRMAISTQQAREAARTAYAAAGASIAGHQSALGINNQAIQIDYSGRINSILKMLRETIPAQATQDLDQAIKASRQLTHHQVVRRGANQQVASISAAAAPTSPSFVMNQRHGSALRLVETRAGSVNRTVDPSLDQLSQHPA